MPADPPAWVAVGRITRAHGVKGEVAVLPLSEVASRFEPGSSLVVDEDRRRAMGLAAQQRVRDFDIERAARQLESLYVTVVRR